jgi:CMP-N-acetylneuraminic acid synthetase
MEFLSPEFELIRTQDLELTFHDAGQFYWGTSDAWLLHERMHSKGAGLVIPHWRVVDIDTNEDWLRAEILFQTLKNMRKDIYEKLS